MKLSEKVRGKRGWNASSYAEIADKIAQLEARSEWAGAFPLSHEGCDAFWEYWEENGEAHKHGYYESTWGAIRAYLNKAATTKDQRAYPDAEKINSLLEQIVDMNGWEYFWKYLAKMPITKFNGALKEALAQGKNQKPIHEET